MNDEEVFARFYISCYARRIANIILFIGVIAILVAANSNSLVWTIVGIILITAGAIIQFIYWRCPVCSKPLPYRETAGKITYCINCGTRLKP